MLSVVIVVRRPYLGGRRGGGVHHRESLGARRLPGRVLRRVHRGVERRDVPSGIAHGRLPDVRRPRTPYLGRGQHVLDVPAPRERRVRHSRVRYAVVQRRLQPPLTFVQRPGDDVGIPQMATLAEHARRLLDDVSRLVRAALTAPSPADPEHATHQRQRRGPGTRRRHLSNPR